jgi:elongation factor Ts
MADISATLVKQLRDKTGAGMGLCKEALVAEKGDLKKAEEWLRAKGVKADTLARATAEGALVVQIAPNHKDASIVELKCETDFAAKNDRFRKLAHDIAGHVLRTKTKDAQTALTIDTGNGTIDQLIKSEISGVIKENIKFEYSDHKTLDGPGKIGSYVHSNAKLAVLVGVKASSDAVAQKPELDALLKDLAMHIAGSAPFPVAVDRKNVPSDLVEAEKRVIMKQLNEDPKESKKPDNIKEKIADGKLGRFYKERVLLEQPFVKDDSKTVQQWLDEQGKALGGKLEVLWFVRRALGA